MTVPSLPLETKPIGSIDFAPTVLALGCWVFGGNQWGGQEDQDSISAMQAALDAGITHFDTARAYGGGRSEKLVGEFLKNANKRIFLATKTGTAPKDKTLEAINDSLVRLQTDCIDLFYIHWPRQGVDLRPTMEALEQARTEGKIRAVGVSNFSIEQMQQVMEVGVIDAHQFCYNLFWRWDEKDIIPFCVENKIAVVTYSSIAQGILTGKFGPNPTFPQGDGRAKMVMFEPDVWPHVYQGVEQLKKIAQKANRPLTHLAIRWINAQPGISSILVGARNAKQLEENVAAMAGEIAPAIFEEMTAVSDEVIKHIPDTGNIFRANP